jgi:hypothetical protein
VNIIRPIIPIREVINAIFNSLSSVISMIFEFVFKVEIVDRILTCNIYLIVEI